MIERQSLENVQAGDTLIWHGRGLADSRVVKVDRTTKTQIIIGGNRFRKADGRTVGESSWHSASVSIPREGEIERIREARLHQKLVYKINDECGINKLRDMSLEQLKQLDEVLNSCD